MWFPHTIQFSLVMVALAKEYILEGWFTNCIYRARAVFAQTIPHSGNFIPTHVPRFLLLYEQIEDLPLSIRFLEGRGVQHRYRHTSHGLSMGSKCGSYIHARLNQEFVVIPQISLYRWATVWSLQTKQVLNICNIYQSSLLEERK